MKLKNPRSNLNQNLTQFFVLTLTILIFFTCDSFAGTGGSEWNTLKTKLLGWLTGTPGYIAGLIWLVFGITKIPVGEFKQLIFSLIAIAAVVLAPTIVGTTITALI